MEVVVWLDEGSGGAEGGAGGGTGMPCVGIGDVVELLPELLEALELPPELVPPAPLELEPPPPEETSYLCPVGSTYIIGLSSA